MPVFVFDWEFETRIESKMASTTMQLEFEQAMTDFKTMFPEVEVDVIEAILRCNKGAVDATIDQLLAMSTDNQVSGVEDDNKVLFW